MIIAKDLMSPNPWFLHGSDLVKSAIEKFAQKQFKTLPILDSKGEVLGVLSEIGLLKCIIYSKSKATEQFTLNSLISFLDQPVLVLEDDPIHVIVNKLTKAPTQRVLVVNHQNKLIGVISPKDIIFNIVSSGSPTISRSLQRKVEALEGELATIKKEVSVEKNEAQILNQFKQLIESSLFLCHSVTENGKIRFANKRLHEILGYQDGELAGKDITELYPSHLHDIVRNALSEIENKGKQSIVYSAFLTKKGESVKVEMSSIAIYENDSAAGNKRFMGTATVSRVIDSDIMLRVLSGAVKYDKP